ncbi:MULTISPECIES: 3'-5' exonuclease [Roseiflexus]|jgi:DNA polymerase-3 subunit epsilon|uniref:DNA polymerase III, epsilon subunit n=1 Tax=Roseiflexus castenholzii (strain DSM 13941 / HLO8) TaxID=383372 RepID=A7NQX0_ROSCS|nr:MULTISPECIES: 3'-5' exonuclease [Roseiflexus]ABU59966.1 DNA polymerase III, epsilon subunit [Roseiflexus castenholzii DSM 13941]GIW02865.1 MAG: DNA polymerase III subunit epsilon [Roseiflexus sp.]
MFLFRRRPAHLPESVVAYLEAQRPDPALPWRAAPYSVMDVETTGLNPRRDALLAIGLVEIDEGRIRMDRRWYTLVHPPDDAPINPESIRIHGLLPQDVEHAPPLDAVVPDVLRRLTGRVLVVHVADVDIGFLRQAMRRLYGVDPRGPAIDTARLAWHFQRHQRLIEGLGSEQEPALQLRALAESLGLPVYPEHNAFNDALTTAQLFLAQVSMFEAQSTPRLRDLLRAGGCLR